MPDDIAQAQQACQCHHHSEGGDAKATHAYQSVWMAHWNRMPANSNSATRDPNNRTLIDCHDFRREAEEAEEGDHGGEGEGHEQHVLLERPDVAIHVSTNAGACTEATRATRVSFTNEANPEKSKTPSFGFKSFPMFSLFPKADHGMLPLNGEVQKCQTEASSEDDNVSLNGTRTLSHLPSTSVHVPTKTETSFTECQLLSEGILPADVLTKSSDAVQENNLAVSSSLWNDCDKSNSGIVLYGHGKGKSSMTSFTHGLHEIYQSSYNLASKEQGHFTSTKYHHYSSLLMHKKKMSGLLDPQRSSFSKWMQTVAAPFPRDPLDGRDDGLDFGYGQHQKLQNYAANAMIRNKNGSSLESTKPQNFCGGSSLVPQLPCSSVHDVESMKIYTTTDSVEESSRGPPKISQTTHPFLMSKKTNVNLSDKGKCFRESIAPTKFKGNAFSEILDFSPPTNVHTLKGAKLEAVGRFMKSKGIENVLDLKSPTSLRNESSAETDTMDINTLPENHLPGNVPFPTNECIKDSQNLSTSQVAITSAEEKTKAKSANTALPDINQVPPELPTLESPVVDKETSTSRTHSLGLECLLSYADEHAKSKSSTGGKCSLGPEPSSRWVKRLKLCKSGSAHGTKSAKIVETSSLEKPNNAIIKIMQCNKTSLEPKMICQAEERLVPDLPPTILTNGKSSFAKVKKTVDTTLSHLWIQRWSHNHAASSQKRHELVELCEPKSSNSVLNEFQKKQFPSIAAMALMGKAMSSLNPYESMKKGPLMVWSMK